MDIFGVGGWELVTILLIMLIVAGPKRMIQWSYTLGTYLAKLRRVWAETARALQKELDDAGVDIKVPEQVPTRQTLKRDFERAISPAIAPITKPVQEAVNELQTEVNTMKTGTSPQAKRASAPQNGAQPQNGFGSWSTINKEDGDAT